ncbi:MAG: glycosyltransferase [bacterium]
MEPRLKILVVSHNCVLTSAQERLVELSKIADEKPVLLVPPKNLETQGMVALEKTHDPRYDIVRGRPLLSLVFGKRYFQFYPFMSRLLLRVRPDVIDLHEEPWSLVAFHTILLRNQLLPEAKVIIETEQNIFKRFPPPFSQFERFVQRHADAMLARNSEVIEVLKRKGYAGKIEISPNGLDTNIFKKVDSADLREKLELKNFTAGFIGKIGVEKGIEELLRAAASSDKPIDLLLVGSGPDKAKLRRVEASLSFKGRVVWHPAVEQKNVPRYLGCIDALVLPSRTTATWKEQFGRILVEAMACGVPVVGSDSGAIPEVIGDAGMIFPEGDAGALFKVLEKLGSDENYRRELIKRGLKKVEEQYSWSAVVKQLMRLFGELQD